MWTLIQRRETLKYAKYGFQFFHIYKENMTVDYKSHNAPWDLCCACATWGARELRRMFRWVKWRCETGWFKTQPSFLFRRFKRTRVSPGNVR